MRFRHWVMILVFTWLYASASVGAYRNVGGEGGVCYVAELDQVPPEQGVDANEDAGPEKDVTAKTERESDGAGDANAEMVKKVEGLSEQEKLPAEGKLGPRAKDLEQTRKWLQKEYKALLEIQEEIHREQRKRLGPSAQTRLDEKIKKYSKRLGEYEKKGQAYDEDLETFNALRQEEKELRKQLRQTEIQLEKDYESLRVQKLEISRMANMELSRSDRQKLADKLREYNAQVKEYKEKKEAFQKALEYYDARIKHALEGSE